MKLSIATLSLSLFFHSSTAFELSLHNNHGYCSAKCQLGSSSSAFMPLNPMNHKRFIAFNRGDMLMYNSPSDPPNKNGPSSSGDKGKDLWSVMANTERWISETLAQSGSASSPGSAAASNPYVRKEVSYVCEASDEIDVITGGIFSRLREMREVGESHARHQEELRKAEGPKHKPSTFRQTLVVVIPNNEDITKSYQLFDGIVQAINNARRNARDYVTDTAIEKLDRDDADFVDWIISINMAHLHPQYGVLTPEEILAQEQEEDEEGEVDLNMKAYKEKRMLARRSPHPSLVIEVRSTPPPVMEEPKKSIRSKLQKKSNEEGDVSKDDVKKLEALFGKSVTFEHETEEKKSGDDAFYEAIGNASGIQQISFETPLSKSQSWVIKNVENFDENSSSFTICDTKLVDSAYEFVFTNIAMHNSMKSEDMNGKTNYLVMPHYLSASATSFEKFSVEVQNIINTNPMLSNVVTVSTFHPEHIKKENRSPSPIFVLNWKKI